MLVELACCTGSTPDPWAIFTSEGGEWRPIFVRAGVNGGGVEIDGNELVEEIPIYGPGDPSADPQGSKTVRFEVNENGSVAYRPPNVVQRGSLQQAWGRPTITLDQYGHLLPGAEDEAAGRLDAFLARQVGGADEPTASQCAAHPVESQSSCEFTGMYYT